MKLVTAPTYVKYSELNKGDVVVDGFYVESYEGKFGTLHAFDDREGQRVVLPKAGQLDYLISSHLVEGQECKIVYDGKVKLEKGTMAGKEANQFNLYKGERPAVTTNNVVSSPVSNIPTDDLE